jgi:hypothetical protein
MFACSVVSRATVCTLIALLALFPRAGAGPPPVRREERGPYGLPARMRDLRDLRFIKYNNTLTPLQKMEVVLAWLAEERRDPSPTVPSIGGFPIGSDYIERELVGVLGWYCDLAALDWTLASGQVEDEGMRDDIRLALGARGDSRQIDALKRILREDPSPGHRYLAAQGLGQMGVLAAIPLLERALEDPYSVTAVGGEHNGERAWPVRRVAREELRVLRMPDQLTAARERRRVFARMLAHGRKALVANKAVLRRLVLAANGQFAPASTEGRRAR